MGEANSILKEVPAFVESVVAEAASLGLNLKQYPIDHFCFRVESSEQYSHYKKLFAAEGELLSEAQIAGRPIATFKLKEAVEVLGQKIYCVEIPSPKEGAPYALGLEHIECVVEEALTVFAQRFPALKFDTRGMKKPINAELALKLPSGKSVKFHNQSLETVIEIEKKLGL